LPMQDGIMITKTRAEQAFAEPVEMLESLA
jgi:hypothetical protein